MRDVEYGWLMRYMHSTGASAFFFLMYFHMFRGLLYGSYQKPKELVWLFGCFLLFLLMAEGFLGYVLPWGQMSYWAANVILSLFGAIPYIGPDLQVWIQGDYVLSGITLSRFFALHVVVVPLLMIALVVFHIFALHEVGAGNPEGVDIEKHRDSKGMPLDGAPFHPYKTFSALPAIGIFFIVFFAIVFFAPTGGGYLIEKPNFEEADFLKTPEHIAPVFLVAHADKPQTQQTHDQLYNKEKAEEKKLKASALVTSAGDGIFLGRTGLNGIYKTKATIGGLHCFLFFDWHKSGGLREVTLQTQPVSKGQYVTSLQGNWSELIDLLNKLHGRPVQAAEFPSANELQDGAILGLSLIHI